jgi:hypothetical protein
VTDYVTLLAKDAFVWAIIPKFFNGVTDYKTRNVAKDIPSEDLITGYYAFGANELSIYRALNKIVKHLVKNYGLKLPKA